MNKKIEKIEVLSDGVIDELVAVWEKSVRSSHHFLKEEDIAFFKPLVKEQYLPSVMLFVIRNEAEWIAAFMGLGEDMLEMLFVLPEEQGKKYGKTLVGYALDQFHIVKVDVNEDNKQTYQFYLHMGYELVGRDACDATGKPFPILHLRYHRKLSSA